jgi:citrate synthase
MAFLRHLSVTVSSRALQTLQERMGEQVPEYRAKLKGIKEKYGKEVLGTCTVDQAIGGMRSVKSMLYETSLLDAEEGIRFRGYTIPEASKLLPKAPGGSEPLPEGLFWLLCTGEIPSQAQVASLTADLERRSALPAHVRAMIQNFPKNMHPMSQFSAAVLGLQTESLFAKVRHFPLYCLDLFVDPRDYCIFSICLPCLAVLVSARDVLLSHFCQYVGPGVP